MTSKTTTTKRKSNRYLEILERVDIVAMRVSAYPTITWQDIPRESLSDSLLAYLPQSSYWQEFFDIVRTKVPTTSTNSTTASSVGGSKPTEKKQANKAKAIETRTIWQITVDNLSKMIYTVPKTEESDSSEEDDDDSDDEGKKPRIIFPPPNLVWSAFVLTNPKEVKVVILGQDPYPSNSAMGLSFSVPHGNEVNSSLQNIYKNMEKFNILLPSPKGKERSGLLTMWALQGVLMINTSLTVTKDQPNSHKGVWTAFTNELIDYLTRKDNLVWIVWGGQAHKEIYRKVNPLKNRIITSSHPSGKSCNASLLGFGYGKKTNEIASWPAFMECDWAGKTNEALKNLGYDPKHWIKWDMLM